MSSSQSIRISFTVSVLPDVSPFFHNRPRDRDQKCASPVSLVLSNASAFIHATISTDPSRTSCATAGINPRSSHFIRQL